MPDYIRNIFPKVIQLLGFFLEIFFCSSPTKPLKSHKISLVASIIVITFLVRNRASVKKWKNTKTYKKQTQKKVSDPNYKKPCCLPKLLIELLNLPKNLIVPLKENSPQNSKENCSIMLGHSIFLVKKMGQQSKVFAITKEHSIILQMVKSKS